MKKKIESAGWECIDEKRPDSAREWIMLILTIAPILWIGLVLWVVDKKEYHKTVRWLFEKRTPDRG